MPVTNFIWDELSDNVRMEVDETGAVTAEYMNEPSQFGNLLSQRRDGTNGFYHFDAQGSSRHLSNETETVTDSYTYTAFGEPVASSGSTTNPFRFNGAIGYYTNSELDDMYVRRRTYQPDLGRWHTIDPLLFQDSVNLYVYVSNQPTNLIDPSGLREVCCCFLSIRIIRPPWAKSQLYTDCDTIEAGGHETTREACERVKRDSWFKIAVTSISNFPCTTLISHGRYCGLSRRAGPCDAEPIDAPKDDVDRCCWSHDCCLPLENWLNAEIHRKCNCEFIACLDAADCTASPDPLECDDYRKRALKLTVLTLYTQIPLP